ncbi:MAG: delta-60 repeat domain-containing protein [Patescibacteria group bacterium]|jgi:uncharacterized delta-60 repeat protein
MKKSVLAALLCLSMLSAAVPAFAAPGDVDLTFNASTAYNRVVRTEANGTVDAGFNPGTGANSNVVAVGTQSDGKVIVAGHFTSVNGTTRNRIARLNADGSFDATFDPGTGADSAVMAIAIQSDDKIVVGGTFTTFNGTSVNRLTRLEADGTIDATFNATGTAANGGVYKIALQSDNKIVIAGSFTSFNDTTRNRVARLETNGLLDETFDPADGPNNSIYALGIQTDGKIVIGGDFSNVGGVSRNRVARLETTGVLDETFDIGTGGNGGVNGLVIQPDQKIVITGSFINFNGASRPSVARLETTGAVDATFVPPANNGGGNAIALQADGKILVGGNFSSVTGTLQANIFRLEATGALDTTYDAGNGTNSTVSAILVQGDGKIVLAGSFTSYDGSGPNSYLWAIDQQADGDVLIGGEFRAVSGVARNRVARLNADGTLDAAFDASVGANGTVRKVHALSNGDVLIVGEFSQVAGVSRNKVARLNADGSLDTDFDPGTGANLGVYTSALQSDGKLVIGGDFTVFDGTTRFSIARLNTDGTLDATFDPGAGFNGRVLALRVHSDGTIAVGGEFTTADGVARNHIARLNADGSLDTSFDPGTGANGAVNAVDLQLDGKVVLGGDFTSVNGTSRNFVARMNANGTLDTTFDPGTGASSSVYAVASSADNKLSIGGVFTSVNGTSRGAVARLNADGSVDTGFDPGTGANFVVYAMKIQTDGNVLFGGSFMSVDGLIRNNLARVEGSLASAGISISETSGATSVSESGSTDTFSVVLNATPISDVVLNVSSGDTTEATVSPATLTFTNANWNTPQAVTVTGVDDAGVDGTQTATITIAVNAASSTDEYDAVSSGTVSASVTDNDVASGGGGGGGGGAPQPAITLSTPNGGEVLNVGTTKLVLWSYQGDSNHTVRLDLSTDNGLTYSDEVVASAPGTGSYLWTIPDKTVLSAKLRAQLLYFGSPVATDVSDATFMLLGTDAGDLPRSGSGTGTAPIFISSASINEDKGIVASTSSTPCVNESLIRTASQNAVYYCGANGKRYVFPNEKIYFSWYADFSTVTVVSDETMASIQIGGNVTYKPGSRMIKVESDPKTYVVSRGGQLRHVTTEAIAISLYGTTWNTKIDDLPVGFFTDYTIIAPITSADLP